MIRDGERDALKTVSRSEVESKKLGENLGNLTLV